MGISFPLINHPLKLIPYLLAAVPLQADEYSQTAFLAIHLYLPNIFLCTFHGFFFCTGLLNTKRLMSEMLCPE